MGALSCTTCTETQEIQETPETERTPLVNDMVYIEGGTFIMGSPREEEGRFSEEGPQHQVTVGSFYMGRYEVTQKEYEEVMGSLPEKIDRFYGKGDDNPVYVVSWYDAIEFCNARSRREGLTPAYTIDKDRIDPNNTMDSRFAEVKWLVTWDRNADGYRLPTEAEWEYACRAGTTTPWYSGETSDNLGDYVWYDGNSRGMTHPVGQKLPNAWGLYDMHGNVSELCWDWWGRNYPDEAQINPLGPSSGSLRQERGGNWYGGARHNRSAYRQWGNPANNSRNTGFRLARGTVPVSSSDNDYESQDEAESGYFYIGDETPQNSFVYINGGTFTMGSPSSEQGRYEDEDQRQVTVSSFYMEKYEVTQKEYQEMMGTNPSNFEGDNLPVEMVSWYDAVEYCNARSRRDGLTPAYTISGSGNNRTVTWNRDANGYRLPTEAEWEYACRAGTTTAFNTGARVSNNTGWFVDNSGNTTRPVGRKPPNAWGLYDMHGNVYEWCWDWYGDYPNEEQIDPAGASSGSNRVLRGGSWSGSGQGARSAGRLYIPPSVRRNYLGFRLARNWDGGATVSFDNIQFQADTAIMLPGEQEKLDRIVDILRRYQDRDILVSGHTALAGTAGGRKQLSEERAAVVANYIISQNACPPERVIVRGLGADRPLGDNSTPEGMRINRRVEITILEN
jgi:formylglycine-generating enzyme required for sulfatase activity